MIEMAPDTQQNLLYAVYFTISHNIEAILYFGCMCLAIFFALIKPTRAMILIMIGFGLLLFGFQYNKHILEPLKTQTQSALITERQSYRTQRAIDLALARVLPKAFPVAGWSLIIIGFLGGVLYEWRPKQGISFDELAEEDDEDKLRQKKHPTKKHV